MPSELWNTLVAFIRGHWYRRSALVVLLATVMLAYVLLASKVKVEDFSLAEVILLPIVLLVTFGICVG